MDCILFKWKLSLFLDFLKYIYIYIYVYYQVWGDKMIRIFKILQNFKDIFKKKIFFSKILGGLRPPLVIKWLHHCFHLHLHAWHNSGHRKKNHNTEAEKFAGITSNLQKNKSKLLYVCIVITLEYFNSFTIDQNTHIKKIL